MYMYVCINMCIYFHIHIYMYIYIYLYICLYIHTFVYVIQHSQFQGHRQRLLDMWGIVNSFSVPIDPTVARQVFVYTYLYVYK